MSYLKFILINLLLVTLFNTGLGAKDNPNFIKKVRNKVGVQMDYPKNRMEGSVCAQFSVADDKTLVIKSVDSQNEDLEEFVKKELEKMLINVNHNDTKKVFAFEFVFKREKVK